MQQGELFPMGAGGIADFERISHTIDLARREVNRQKPDLALAHLRSIKYDMEKYAGTPCWVEFNLVQGEAFLAKDDTGAGEVLKGSVDEISRLPGDHPELMTRASRGYAALLDRFPDLRSEARAYYEMAKQLAVKHRYREDCAEITLRIIKIDLQLNESPELPNFMMLKKTADSIYTCQEQLAAWHLHLGNIPVAAQGRVFARNERVASVEYFRNLLELARGSSLEEENDEE